MASTGREYFAEKYFATGYWHTNYWFDATPALLVGGRGIPTMPTIPTIPTIARQLHMFILYSQEVLNARLWDSHVIRYRYRA